MMEVVFQLKNQNEPIGKTVKTSGVAESPIWTNSAKQKGLKDHRKQLKHMNELFSWFRKETSQNADKSKTFVCVSLPGSTTVPSIYVKHGGCMITNGTGTQMFIDKTEVAV